MRTSKYFLIAFAFIFLIGLIGLGSAEVNFLGNFKQGECVTIKQTCGSCSYINATISYPNSSIAVSNQGMSNQGGGVWTYEFCNTTKLGRYDINGKGDLQGTPTGFDVLWFEISPNGGTLTSANAIALFGSLLVMVIISLIFLYVATRSESIAAKTSFYSFSAIGFIMVILYTVVIAQQTLFGFESIVTGIETFWFIAKIGIWLGLLSLGIVVFLVLLKAWKIKRGFADD